MIKTEVTTFTKKDIARRLVTSFPEKTPFTTIQEAVGIIFNVLKAILIQKNCINMLDIGYLCPKFKEKRDGARNPKTNDEHSVEAHWTVTRRIGKNEQPTYIHGFLVHTLQHHLHHNERFQRKDHAFAEKLITEFYRIIATVKKGNIRFEIRNFGSFSPVYQKALLKRNPKTGELIQKSAHYKVHFKLSKSLHEQINETNTTIDKYTMATIQEAAMS